MTDLERQYLEYFNNAPVNILDDRLTYDQWVKKQYVNIPYVVTNHLSQEEQIKFNQWLKEQNK